MKNYHFNKYIIYIVSFIFLVFLILLSTSIGNENIKFFDILKLNDLTPNIKTIILELRLPRVVLAILIGGSLSVSGACLQSILKNPIASPFTLGISSGASVLVGLMIVFNINFLGELSIPFFGFLGGIITIFIVLSFANRLDKGLSGDTIILVGIIISLFVNSILILITSINYTEISKIILWQMGSLSLKDWNYVFIFLPFVIVSFIGIFYYSKQIDIISLGDEKGKSLGVNTKKSKTIIIIFTAILTGGAVSISGVIGFVGLIIPHIVRKLLGFNHTTIIPFSFIFGGIFLLIADILSKTLIYPSEIPIGAITACIGTPFFIIIFFTKKS